MRGYTVYCTSLVRDVFNIHFLAMHEDGFVMRAWEKHFHSKHGGASCSLRDAGGGGLEEQATTLGWASLGGIFILHYFSIGLAIVCAIFGKLYDKYCRRRVHKIEAKVFRNISDTTITTIDFISRRNISRGKSNEVDQAGQLKEGPPAKDFPRSSLIAPTTNETDLVEVPAVPRVSELFRIENLGYQQMKMTALLVIAVILLSVM